MTSTRISTRRLRLVSALLVGLGGIATQPALAQADLRSGTLFSNSEERFGERSGQDIFEGICQGCHMADAKGATGAGTYPALAENARLASPFYPATMVLNGSRAMPGFGDTLDDEQIANVVNYLRSHFGNSYNDTLSAEQVKAMRH